MAHSKAASEKKFPPNTWQGQYQITPPNISSASSSAATTGSSTPPGSVSGSSSSSASTYVPPNEDLARGYSFSEQHASGSGNQSKDLKSYSLVSKQEEARQEAAANLHRSVTSATLPPAYSEEDDTMAPLPPPPLPSIFENERPSRANSMALSTTRDASSVYSLSVTEVPTEFSSSGSSSSTRKIARSSSAFAPAYEPEPGKKKKGKDDFPPCFTRQPPDDMDAVKFEPMFLTARNSGALREGFPMIPPPSTSRPHPFSIHDVTEEDWTVFVSELKKTSTLTAGQITKGIVLPYTVWIPGATDYMSYKLRHKYHDENAASAAALVDVWNHHFFGPRSLKAVLLRGKERLSGNLEDQVKNLDLPTVPSLSRISSSQTLTGGPANEGVEAPIPKATNDSKAKKKDDKAFRLFIMSTMP